MWASVGVYLFIDTEFWGQRATPGVTNANQGVLDFSKREYDFTTGVAWNYAGAFEARAFAYSFNNLNRGDSATTPIGYTDGVGLENRYYLQFDLRDISAPRSSTSRGRPSSAWGSIRRKTWWTARESSSNPDRSRGLI